MADAGYRIGPVFAERIAAVVRQVENSPMRIGDASIPTRFEDYQPFVTGDEPLRLCKTTAEFPKNTLATLEVWEACTPPGEQRTMIPGGVPATIENVVNKFTDIPANKFVSIAKHNNGYWYVIAAECG